ncbi:prolyl oligopeptidase family serine peptidase [Brevibacterium sp. S22]|uniref:S9 family peptidase n=1 Tax=Brevibacterium sp. S22 TaxID=2483794 RepID=UPI00197A9646|nr:prolyl oligopeptidase family serine peptidase [Brevibacterium sp. S22]
MRDVTDVTCSPDGTSIACSIEVAAENKHGRQHIVYIIDVETGKLTRLEPGVRPTWSGDGNLLAYCVGDSEIAVRAITTNSTRRYRFQGIIEDVRFSARGSRLLARVAEPGAHRSTANGATVVPGDEKGDDGGTSPDIRTVGEAAPRVERTIETQGWRRLWVLDVETHEPAQLLSPEQVNIWEADWAGDEVVAIASDRPDENAWYDAQVVVLSVRTAARKLEMPEGQFGFVRGSSDGTHVACIAAFCSDRGLVAGNVMLADLESGQVEHVLTDDVDITSLAWRDNASLLASGQRNLETVVGVISLSGSWRPVWATEERTCGHWYPAVEPLTEAGADSFAAVVHSYYEPPALTLFGPFGERRIIDTANKGTDELVKRGGSLRIERWNAPDGLKVESLLAIPDTPGPHPMLVLIHGGPVAAYRTSWHLIYGWTQLLVAAGFAVLHPNPRGSGGRGQSFAKLVRGDIGGADTTDITSGVRAMVNRGVADPSRVSVAGRSYGGFMAAWSITQTTDFTAAIVMAPATNWCSLHFSSNLTRFAETFLGDEVTNPNGYYFTRSPVFFADQVNGPVLNIAGAGDLTAPPTQSMEFHQALGHQGRDSTLVIYPEDGHHIESRHATIDLMHRIIDFLGSTAGTR